MPLKPRKPFHQRPAWSILFFDLTLIPWLKNMSKSFIARKPGAAFLATFVTHPIAGMFYLGRWKRAIFYSIVSPLAVMLEFYLLLHVKDFPNPPFFVLDAIVLRTIGAIDAYFLARSWQKPERERFYMRWYGAIGLWLAVMAGIFAGYSLMRLTVMEVYSAMADINKPTLMKDDMFLLFRLAKTYEPGDIALFEQEMYGYKRGFFWRIIAMPGDTVAIRGSQLVVNGKAVVRREVGNHIYEENGRYQVFHTGQVEMKETTVPEGSYFMLSDNRDMYKNTDFFVHPQFIRMENLKGKVIYICKAPCALKGKF